MVGSPTGGLDLPSWVIPAIVALVVIAACAAVVYVRWTTDRRDETERRQDQLRLLTALHGDARGEIGRPLVFAWESKWVRKSMGSSLSVRRYQWLQSDIWSVRAMGLVTVEPIKTTVTKNGVSSLEERELGKVALTAKGIRAVREQRLPTIEELADHHPRTAELRDVNIITNIGGSVQMSTGNSESDAALLLEKLRSLVDVLPHEIRAEAQSYISEIEQAAANPRQRVGLARRAYRALIGLTSGVIQNATWDSIKILFERVFPSV